MPTRALPCACLLALTLACVDPALRQEQTRASEVELEAGLQDGRSTRQELLLRFGTPTASFEAGRILTFDFTLDASGAWRRAGGSALGDGPYAPPRVGSLVVVFSPEGLLLRHRFVSGLEPEAPKAPE